jgi:hypothetical protein
MEPRALLIMLPTKIMSGVLHKTNLEIYKTDIQYVRVALRRIKVTPLIVRLRIGQHLEKFNVKHASIWKLAAEIRCDRNGNV